MRGNGNPSGEDRYTRTVNLLKNRADSRQIDAKYMLETVSRDMGNIFADPYPLPYNGTQMGGPPGYIYNFACTIANRSTSSAVVIRGVGPGENASLTTIFAILGAPVLSVAFPLWVNSGSVPIYLSNPGGAPMYTYCHSRSTRLYDNPNIVFHLNSHALVDQSGGGIYSYTLPLESWGVDQADFLISYWLDTPPSNIDMQYEQFRIARAIFSGFQLETAGYINEASDNPALPEAISMFNYPNPFNQGTNIVFSGAKADYPAIFRIYDIVGRLINEISGTEGESGTVYWSGRDMYGKDVPSGVYFCTVVGGQFSNSNKMILLK
jgi:hypothetical protein